MHEKFPGYYRFGNDSFPEFWKTCNVIVDANVLLNLYRHGRDGREALFKGLKLHEDRLWLPYYAALEYQSNRLSVIAKQRKDLRDLKSEIESYPGKLREELNKQFAGIRRNRATIEQLESEIVAAVTKCSELLNQQESEFIDVNDDDNIRIIISDLFQSRIGERPSQQLIDQQDKEAARRYALLWPPGYEDFKSKKDQFRSNGEVAFKRAFGDFYIWEEIVAYVSSLPQSQRNVAFVTDDSKEDWWEIVQSKGPKTIGARPELIAEFMSRTGGRLILCNSDTLLHYNKEHLNQGVEEDVIDEVADLVRSSPAFRIPLGGQWQQYSYQAARDAVEAWLVRSDRAIDIYEHEGYRFILDLRNTSTIIEVYCWHPGDSSRLLNIIVLSRWRFQKDMEDLALNHLHIFIVTDSMPSATSVEADLLKSVAREPWFSITFGHLIEDDGQVVFVKYRTWGKDL
jgi:hypothetical protein